ncbi:type IV pilus modification protein PilV [Ideonella sp. A 288]|uniref:type IV pilus modification protein PilV n=1 Tax=Ideonella sp. A 288 TaxID=1962181 RepID=UPI000B4AD2FD|nr:type IV pilus modification protein PilV [Ideonella sp. A 288]
MKTNRRPQRGVALMEALVAVLLLSVCALAYAALQLRGLSSNTSSMWRSKAALLAYEMSDRMRANRTGVTTGKYNNLIAAEALAECGGAVACQPDEMAKLDYSLWNTAIANELPGANGAVCLDATPDDGTTAAPACDGAGTTFAVKVFWKERGEESRLSVAVRP